MTLNKNKLFFGFIGVYFLIPILANFFAIAFAGYTFRELLPDRFLSIDEDSNNSSDVLLFFFDWAAFPIVTLILLVYSRPIYKMIFSNVREPAKLELGRRRVIHSPFISSFISFLGWELSVTLANTRVTQLYPQANEQGLLLIFFVSSFWGFFVFAFSFFTLDYLNRVFFLPYFFPEGGLGKYANTRILSLVTKHVILWGSISLFPIMLLLLGILNRTKLEIENIFEILKHDVLFQLAFVLIALSFCLIWIFANSIQEPLRKMEEATNRIKEQDFNTRVVIHSSDELGVLGDGINEMAKGLAERERIKDTFGKIVDPRIRDYLLNNEHNLGGKTVPATILFSDLRDFTKLSENRTPTEVLFILNRYFQAMSNAVEAHGGFINKFIGDAILAVFGTPLPLENPVLIALETAYSMSENLKVLNLEFEKEDLPSLRMGIGIHTGLVLVGNVGSMSRMEFTVIGDTVNTASRVEGLCKGLKRELLITEACYLALPEEKKRKFSLEGEFELKGRLLKERIYS